MSERFAHFRSHIGIIAAVISHNRVDDQRRVWFGNEIYHLLKGVCLRRIGKIAGVHTVKTGAGAFLVLRNRQHFIREIAQGPSGKFTGMGAE